MKVLVCGGRDYTNAPRIQAVLDEIHRKTPITLLIHGAARGADLLAENWARSREVSYVGEPAQWGKDGKAAGPRRNQRMLEKYFPDLVLAFPGGNGTADMVTRAEEAGCPIRRET